MKQFLPLWFVLVLIGCTAESTLRSLVEEFPSHSSEFNELKDVMLLVSEATKDFQLLSAGVSGKKEDLVDFFDKGPPLSLPTAVEGTFKSHRDQMLKAQKLVHVLGIDYVSVDKERKAVWITIRGGGALASDKGYLYAGNDNIASFQLKRVLPIPNHEHWYAFD